MKCQLTSLVLVFSAVQREKQFEYSEGQIRVCSLCMLNSVSNI